MTTMLEHAPHPENQAIASPDSLSPYNNEDAAKIFTAKGEAGYQAYAETLPVSQGKALAVRQPEVQSEAPQRTAITSSIETPKPAETSQSEVGSQSAPQGHESGSASTARPLDAAYLAYAYKKISDHLSNEIVSDTVGASREHRANIFERGRNVAKKVGQAVMVPVNGLKVSPEDIKQMPTAESKEAARKSSHDKAEAAHARKVERKHVQANRMNVRFDRRVERRENIEKTAKKVGRGALKAAETADLIAIGSVFVSAQVAVKVGKKGISVGKNGVSTANNKLTEAVGNTTDHATDAFDKWSESLEAKGKERTERKRADARAAVEAAKERKRAREADYAKKQNKRVDNVRNKHAKHLV